MNGKDALMIIVKNEKADWRSVYSKIKERPILTDGEAPTPAELGGWTPITILDPEYPEFLSKKAQMPPFVLFVKGDASILKLPKLQLVASSDRGGESKVSALIHGLVAEKVPVSVFWKPNADGDDYGSEAVRAYEGSGVPFAVVIPGRTEPEARDAIADRVAAAGGVAVTEAYPGTVLPEPDRLSYPRVGIGIASGTLVLNGGYGSDSVAEKSAVVEATLACATHRDVGAVPYPPFSPTGSLCNELIRSGALLIDTADEAKALLETGAEEVTL